MLHQVEVLLRETKRWFSRTEWMIRVLGLSSTKSKTAAAGLIMVQIDGLSRPQLEAAIENNRMPFLKKLLTKEHYHLHSLYSGTPSTTPSVQGELFYGVKTAVPAFSFYDKSSGTVQTMYDPTAALKIEETLAEHGESLLKGGSCYCNIYGSGASEPHFCASSFGWGGVLRAANPFVLGFFLIANLFSFLRTLALLFLETFIAIRDSVKGIIAGRDLLAELKFIPSRVAIVILLRELITMGAKIDIARGLPIIHLNLVGYDEQAHRRGPSSLFAHWTLKGIDRSIKRLWRAASHSAYRHYDIWVYSDHGQEDVTPYPRIHGFQVEEAINKVFDQQYSTFDRQSEPRGIQSQRVKFLGGNFLQKLLTNYIDMDESPHDSMPVITAQGPLGLIYTHNELTFAEKEILAQELVTKAHIPVVLIVDDAHKVIAKTEQGTYKLPEEQAQIFGADHPFMHEVTQDIIDICTHKYAGDFTFIGWYKGADYITFPFENGSHAGPGPNETHAFALLPKDTYIKNEKQDYLRPIHLRKAAQQYLNPSINTHAKTIRGTRAKKHSVRVMTYNVHSCIGMDGRISPERVARVIARYKPDIVALQELDVKKIRTGEIDQAHYLAKALEMQFHFHPAIHIEEEKYGDAILTHLPIELVKADILPSTRAFPKGEPRGAIWARIDAFGSPLQFINTHLDVRKRPRQEQVKVLLSKDWLNHPDCAGPTVFCGDFNAVPSSYTYKWVAQNLRDAQMIIDKSKPEPTFFTRFPSARIDHIFVDENASVIRTFVPNTALTRIASDHFPLVADITIN